MLTKTLRWRIAPAAVLLPLLLTLFLSAANATAGEEPSPAEIPVKDTVTLVELGADNCLPCRLLAPIIEELGNDYRGRAAIIHIDVYRQHDLAMKFHPMVTPTLIFFDRQGHEVSRHAGFMDKESIIEKLDKLLAK